MEKRKSALSKVLESLCIHHQQQVLAMLKFLVQEQNAASLCCCNASCAVSSESQKPLIEDDLHGLFCSCEYRLAERGCLQNERQSPGLAPLPVCIKDIHCLSCQTVTIEHIKNILVNRGIANSYNSHRCCSGPLPNIHSTKSEFLSPLLSREGCNLSVSLKDVCRSRSPSPPPLSPVQTEGFEKLKDVISELSALENNKLETNITQPPSLIPAEISSNRGDHEGKIHKTKKANNSDSLLSDDSNCTTNHEKGETAVIFQDLMDRINDKLKSIETTDMTNLVKLSSSDCNTDNDLKLGDLITSLLHNAKASDYSFMELLSQHDKKVENKIIQTRFRKRQETLFAMHKSPDSPMFRRQSLQIKRELASLDENFIRKKYTERNSRKLMRNDEIFSSDKEEFYHCQAPSLQNSKSLPDKNHAETSHSSNYKLQSLQLPLHSLETNLAFDAFSEGLKTTFPEKGSIRKAQEKYMAGKKYLQNHRENPKLENTQTLLRSDVTGLLSRSKRNIVPPEWYSIYVTNNYVFKKSPKAKKVSESTQKKDLVKNIQTESSHDIDLNKIAMNSNLQVVVERLEDTINMAKKSWNNQPLSEGYKSSRKLVEIDGKDQNAGKNMTLSRMTCKEQSLSKSVVASSSVTKSHCMPTIDLSNKRFDNLKKSSILDTGSLISSVEYVPTKGKGIESSSFSTYSSPVKLMFLSEVKSSEGVKYTLTSVGTSQSNDLPSEKCTTHHVIGKKTETNEDIPNAKLENYSSNHYDADTLQRELNKFNCVQETAESSTMFIGDTNSDTPQKEPKEISNSAIESSFKRKPGRPKKIGPQVVKQIKRPIGRPPKPKTDQTDTICQNESFSAGRKSPESLVSDVKEGIYKKSIIVTVIYGRSRRTKRHVSEGSVNISNIMSLNNNVADFPTEYNSLKNIREHEIDSCERISAVSSLTTESEILGSGFEYDRPIKNKSVIPQPSKNIIRPIQKPLAIIRKPGRPAKVKISGISVTINRISPQERAVSISSCLPPLEQENVLGKNLPEEKYDQQCNKMDKTRHTEADKFKTRSKSTVATIPLRHSIRDRKPSLHFLHSLASSSSLIYRNALLHKSYRLHFQKGKRQKGKHRQSRKKIVSKDTPGTRHSRNAKKCLEDNKLVPISEVSLDPIISSNPLLRWWATSTSSDSLLEELNNRFEQITNAWVQVSGDEAENCVKKREHIENNHFKIANPLETCLLELEVSPVKMLFQKKYDLNELCTWFMQTTETQSLSLVRKANARNPLEVINTRGIKLGTKYSDLNTSPFRKHFKKFALSSPSKSAGKLHILHKMINSPLLNVKSNLTLARFKRTEFKRLHHERWRRERKLHNHGTIDWNSKRRNLRFFCQNQSLNKTERETNADIPLQGKSKVDDQCILPPEIRDDFLQQRVAMPEFKTYASLDNKFKSEAKENGTNCSQKDSGPRLGKECSNNWRSKALKDCRIFLRKINFLEHRNTFKLNTVIYSPDSIESGSNHQTPVEESKHFTLRSHSARQNSFKKQSKEVENANVNSPSTDKFPGQLNNSKLSKCVNFDKSPSDSSAVLRKLNKRKRPPWKTTEMSPKRHKRQSCNSGQMANYFSKSQLACYK
ncbi:PREDICTED: uncharacterized protein LOC103603751 [Galeopterus variegatus]|uniref:Uncharacterized protein LOC103603751 n=1 Tax=Galeopterus variegatus TaxID=482537 RepID=A0ABM0S111_GALVR|nr:PREDICTED: uncharacterized protein LOC103603751 [Galeopterus variegatus]